GLAACCVVVLSSSRRPTRSKRDWSSDVCCSDLTEMYGVRRRRKGGVPVCQCGGADARPGGRGAAGAGNGREHFDRRQKSVGVGQAPGTPAVSGAPLCVYPGKTKGQDRRGGGCL